MQGVDVPYAGNSTGNVSKDAKYSLRHGTDGEWQIEIVYYVGPREYYRPATRTHPGLVEMVNSAKDGRGGPFYINEYGHVLVRKSDNLVYCIGRYVELLQFDVDGVIVSAEPAAGLTPGDDWTGPHVGRAYVLSADCSDIYYKITSGNHTREDHLSDHVGDTAALKLASRLSQFKGNHGGRIYINERKQFFAPVTGELLYLGALGNDPWFPEPPI